MAKRKTKAFIMVLIAAMLLIATATFAVVYAYETFVRYNYHFSSYADVLEISAAADGEFTITRIQDNPLAATKADVILRSDDPTATLSGGRLGAAKSPDHTAATGAATGTGEGAYRLVFRDLALDENNVGTVFTCSDPDAVSLYAAIAEAKYEAVLSEDPPDSEIRTVTYVNEYVASVRQLELLNAQSQYNNIFELAGRYYSRVIVDRTVYLIADLTVTADFTVNQPFSFHLLDCTLTLDAGLTIAHPYAGRYFLAQLSGENPVLGDGTLTFKTPKAYYDVDAEIRSALNDENAGPFRLIEYYDFESYGTLLLTDAVSFASGLIPSRIYGDLTLQQYYQSLGVKLDFYIVTVENAGGMDEQTVLTELTGRVVKNTDTANPYYGLDGNLIRYAATTPYTIRVTASKDGDSRSADITTHVVGTSAQALSAAVSDTILEHLMYKTEGGSGEDAYVTYTLFSDIDLLNVIKSVYIASGYTGDITVGVEERIVAETADPTKKLPATDENAIKLVLNGTETARSFTLTFDGFSLNGDGYPQAAFTYTADGENPVTVPVTSFVLRRGTVVLSDSLTLTVALATQSPAETGQRVQTILLKTSSQAEVMYYLKTSAAAFTTNRPYHVLNIKDDDQDPSYQGDGIYRGNQRLTAAWLGLGGIEHTFVQVDDVNGEQPYADWENFFEESEEDPFILVVKPGVDIMDLPGNVHIKYSVMFSDGNQEEFFIIQVYRTIAGEGGENQQFESSNPFDQLFISTDTVWLEGGTFDVPKTANEMFARIEIVSIGGVAYSSVANPMCVIVPEPFGGTQPPYGGALPAGTPVLDRDYTVDPLTGRLYYKTVHFVTRLDFVPDQNTPIKVRCYYYNNGNKDVVLTQEYTIVMPGVFKCDTGIAQPAGATPFVFSDMDFYNMTIALFEQEYGEDARAYLSTVTKTFDFTEGNFVELADGEFRKILHSDSRFAGIELDYSGFNQDYTGSGIDVTGIDRLTNVYSVIFDGLAVGDMSAFGMMDENSALKNLSAADCGITDADLYASAAATQSHLRNIFLETVNLSQNEIARTDNLLARTVRTLDLSGQLNGCLTDIAGLGSISDLIELNVSDNGIYRFEVLKQLNQIQKIYLYNNRLDTAPVPDFMIYGTDGQINIPVYVWLIKTSGVEIYAESTGTVLLEIDEAAVPQIFSTGGKITEAMLEGSVALNAFAAPTKLYAGSVARLESDLADLKVEIVLDGAEGGVTPQPAVSEYIFAFYDDSVPAPSQTLILRYDYAVAAPGSINGTLSAPVACSYIVVIMDTVGSNVLAMREFLVDVHFVY